MNALLRLAVCAASLSLLWAGLNRVDPQLVRNAGPILLSLPTLPEWLNAEEQREAYLTDLAAGIDERMALKGHLVEELLAGRLTLLETAARFRDLNRRGPAFNWDGFRTVYPGISDEERHCREVITTVDSCFARDDCRRTAAVYELEQVLEGYRRSGLVPARQ